MRIVVTGGSGLVGRRIVRRLAVEHDVTNLDLHEPPERVGRFVRCDVLDETAVGAALAGADAVVHAAAIPGPRFGTPEEILRTNVGGTASVARAAVAGSARRFVQVSSEAVLGFVFGEGRIQPLYFPIDEDHPLAPMDPYGRSKLEAEVLLARSFSHVLSIVALRPPWVWVPEEYDTYRRLTQHPEEWRDGLWAYVHGDDLADAVAAAVRRESPPGFQAVYTAAPDNGTSHETRALVERYYGATPLREGVPEFGSLVSSGRAGSLLGFQARRTWRGFLGSR